MGEPKRIDLTVHAERALLIRVILPGGFLDTSDPLGELRSLARTAGAVVVDEMMAKREKPHPGLYVGTGKAQEIADRAQMNDIDVIIFDNDLSPAQVRDLEEITGRKVLDRSELILDIFAAHARTAESRLQVELAQLEYTFPRLTHMWSHLERLAGGASSAAASVGGIGTRGPGEKQIEIDRRLVRKRVSMLKDKIEQIDQRKVRQVRSRSDVFSACIVGYTNAGKSTLMRLLTGADVLVADQLFATLETKTARWHVSDGESVLLSDTVGFVRDLPHHLVASFKATLEEALQADLLIHVADASAATVEMQIKAVNKVLAELDRADQPQLLVLNKIDRITDPAVRTILAARYPAAIFASAATGEGAAGLAEAVLKRSDGAPIPVRLSADCRNGRLMQYIAQHASVRSETFQDNTAVIEAVMPIRRIRELEQFKQDVRVL